LKGQIIVPLDLSSLSDALELVDRLGDVADYFKVGHQLFTAEGPAAVREVKSRGKRVFLDLKYCDIPNTVRHGVESAVRLGVNMCTVHVGGGTEMMIAAASGSEGSGTLVVGVTILTSMTVMDVEAVWNREINALREEAVRLATLASEAGLSGVVCSPLEVKAIRRSTGDDFKIVTPGIRFPEGDAHDQARVATPASATADGCDYLVIGRAITGADDPAAAHLRARQEISAALEG
jgi:orotidine-5'-phosphate decarboxylase